MKKWLMVLLNAVMWEKNKHDRNKYITEVPRVPKQNFQSIIYFIHRKKRFCVEFNDVCVYEI